MRRRSGVGVLGLLALLCLSIPASGQTGITRYVNHADPTCGGNSPCYTSIQAAVTAVLPGQTILIQAGTYVEQVSITGKNNTASASEVDRIVIEADPAAAPGSVTLAGAVGQCTNGHAIRLQQSKFVTIRGLTITGAGGQAISLLGGNNQNQAIHLERLRIFGNGSASCDGGITIARGNPGTLILNSLIYANGRHGVSTIDADGGPHYLIGNTIHANQWSGVSVTRLHETFLVNNAITGNGTAAGSTGGRFGVKREGSTSPQPAGIHLLNNLICGNRLGEIDGPVLDSTDSGNLTLTGTEGPGVSASPGCDTASNLYGDLHGADGVAHTADDDFTPVTNSPLLDGGLDPRTLGLDPAFNPLLESDYLAPAARPRLGTPIGTARFDIGAREPDVADEIGPLVTILAPPANSYVRLQVPVQAQATDQGSGVATFTLRIGTQALSATLTPTPPPPAASVTATATWNTTAFPDGTHTLTAEAEDAAGNPGSATRILIVDNTAPETFIDSGPSGEIATTNVTFTFSGADTLTPVGSLQFAWRLDGGAWSPFSGTMTASFSGLSEAPHTFEVKARDLAGNEDATPAARSFTVVVSPTITDVTPTSGPIGTYVTVMGARFDLGPTQVTFNGLAAVVRTLSATTITTTVPIGATTGPLTVTTAKGSASVAFTVALTGDFTLTAAPTPPATLRVIAGDQGFASIRAGGTGSFTSLVSLAVPSLPSGVTAAFSPQLVAPGAGSYLDLAVAGSVAPGLYPVTVNGTAQVDGREVTRTTVLTLEVLAAGTPAVTGRILTAESIPQPIPGVTVVLGSAFVLTDAAGNFVLQAAPPGPNMLFVDGRTASTPGDQFPIVETQITVNASGPTRVPFIIYLPKLDTANVVTLSLDGTGAVTQDTVVTTPRIPGLEIKIPAGTRITGPDGNPVSQIVITPVPLDRSPMPFPPNVTPTMLFAINPGGAVPSQPLPITFPNNSRAGEGATSNLHYFDLTVGNWSVWGTGTVSADGSQIVSDPGFGLPRFAWHFPELPADTEDEEGGPQDPTDGDPVDLVIGRFTVAKTDLTLPGRIPIHVRRSYKSGTSRAGLLGIGWHLEPYDSRIRQVGTRLTLVLADRTGYRFTAAGSGQWRNTTDPSLIGAVITELPGLRNFQLRFKDGTIHRFQALQGVSNASGLTAIVDRNGNTVTVARATVGTVRDRITRITDPAARELILAYDADGRVTSATDPIGREVGYTYDTQGRLATVTDAAGGVTRYAYDADHQITSITDARDIVYLTNVYDSGGRVIRQTQADGGIWRFDYSAVGEGVTLTVVTNPRGHATTHRFDPRGFPLSRTNATGQTMPVQYAAGSNLVTERADPLGRPTRFTYDTGANVTGIMDPSGQTRTFTYESTFNRVASVTDPLGNTASLEYDARGNVTALVSPVGGRTTMTYTGFGQPASVQGATGDTVSLTYDGVGNLISTTSLGQTVRRQYDAAARIVRQVDPRGRMTMFAYDALNRLTTVTDPAAGVTRFTYDANGNLVTATDARGGTTAYTYDLMDRVTSKTDPLGAVETFEYDAMGNLTRHRDRRGQVTMFVYDALNRRVTRQDGAGVVHLAYDAVGHLKSVMSSDGQSLHYDYDSVGRITAERSRLGSVGYGYDAAGRRAHMDAAGAPRVTYAYDTASRLTSISQAPLAPTTLEYDAAGRRTRLTLPNQISTEYHYDSASRPTALTYRNATGVLGDLSYRYDRAGNRVAVGGSFARTLLPEAVAGATYDAASRQLVFGAATMAYDANGSLVTLSELGSTTQLGWDARGRLASLTTPSGSATFTYDPRGRRVERRLGAAVTGYLYDGQDIVAEATGGSETSYLRTLLIDEPVSRDGSEFYLTDTLGSIVALAGMDGVPQTRYTYAPFGDTLVEGATENRFAFTGRETDGADMYFYRARYYRPALHRFLSEDPAPIAPADSNLYTYALNKPLTLTDPSGQMPPLLAGALVGGVIGGTVGGLGYIINNGPGNVTLSGFLISTGVGFGAGAIGGLALGGGIVTGILTGAAIGVTADIAGQLLTNGGQPIDVNSVVIAGIAGAVGGVGSNLALMGGAAAGLASGVGGAGAAGVELGLRHAAARAAHAAPDAAPDAAPAVPPYAATDGLAAGLSGRK